MSSQINRPPLGLQQLLGSQNFGQNPPELKADVQSTVELLPFYGSGLLRMESNAGARTAKGEVSSVVLDGRVALLHASLEIYNPLTAPEDIGASISMRNISGNDPTTNCILHSTQDSYTNPAEPVLSWYSWPNPLIVEEGVRIVSAYWYKSTANLVSSRLKVVYYDLSPTGSV